MSEAFEDHQETLFSFSIFQCSTSVQRSINRCSNLKVSSYPKLVLTIPKETSLLRRMLSWFALRFLFLQCYLSFLEFAQIQRAAPKNAVKQKNYANETDR